MEILQTILKKKMLLSIAGTIILLSVGGILYIVNAYGDEPKAQSKTTTTAELPNGTYVTVNVNNFLDSLPKSKPQESKPEVILPPIKPNNNDESKPRTFQQLMSTSPTAGAYREERKPTMLVVGDLNRDNSSNSPNAITGTNTTVGTGVIDSKLTKQKSPYTIFAGTFLPATMVTGLNSELNGVIVAMIRNDVYDSTTGKYLLIPQGSKLVGTYNNEIAYSQNRLMAGWNRLIYPNGTSMLLHGQPGTDLQGFSGLTGDIDNHYAKIFGASFLMGLIFGGATAATGQQNTNPYQMSAGATIATQVGAQMSQTGLQVVSKGLNIPPTIIVSPGYKFNVLTTADLILKPYIYQGAR
ncbi:MAG: TrbI/VirB10 family protein [Neisseriaceae bacterium]|jgi:type IV secretory pathway VirB10-like protein